VPDQAAASSIASGMPSSRAHAVRTAACAAADSAGWTARAANRATASSPDSGGTRHTVSPATPSGSRLVASMVTPGQARTSSTATSATAPSTCSQLSRQSSNRRSPICRASEAPAPLPRSVASTTPSAAATSSGTTIGSPVAARSTQWTPSGQPARCRVATSTASRVLPQPPGPARVTSLAALSAPARDSSSDSRPTKLVSGVIVAPMITNCPGRQDYLNYP
jgi:hypothetical protein